MKESYKGKKEKFNQNIKLLSPIVHLWYFKNIPNYIANEELGKNYILN